VNIATLREENSISPTILRTVATVAEFAAAQQFN
jgi:hypothetical protein